MATDLSPSGIRDLRADALSEGLCITAVLADIRDYNSESCFDVIVVDRTLHMLVEDERSAVLSNLLGLTKTGTHVLIADERSNIPAFKSIFAKSPWKWRVTLERGGFFFVVRG